MRSAAVGHMLPDKQVIAMSTRVIRYRPPPHAGRLAVTPAVEHGLWLAGGLLLAFLIPFVLADTLEINRDLYYGLYAAGVIGYVTLWARADALDLVPARVAA
jgi:hypothetical protein